MKRCVIICGPTASGKTGLSIELAKRFNGTVISADSMQIYRGMDVGTAKPTEEERCGIPHRLIDVCLPGEPFSVVQYQTLAKASINEALDEGRLPLLTGGTGLYIDSILYNTRFSEVPENCALRSQLETEYELSGGETMLRRLREIDPVQADKLSAADKKRIVRAMEVFLLSGKTLTECNAQSRSVPSDYHFLLLVLSYRNRDILYDRINRRVDQMMESGLLEEARHLMIQGVAQTPTASQAIGYKELFGYLRGEATQDQAVELLKQRSRNYAKRQITWFKRYNTVPLYMDDPSPTEEALRRTEAFLKEEL